MRKNASWYITFNEAPNGLYESQVLETLQFVEEQIQTRYVLIAFISLRGFFSQRSKIKSKRPQSIVIPSIPGFRRLADNAFLALPFAFLHSPQRIIGRGPLATLIGLKLRKLAGEKASVVFDARGLAAAEHLEYNIYPPHVGDQLQAIEKVCLTQSDRVSIITDEMFSYWHTQYPELDPSRFETIPCTLSERFGEGGSRTPPTRSDLGVSKEQILLCYVGSTAQWQSFPALMEWVRGVLNTFPKTAVLLLTDATVETERLQHEFPNRVHRQRVPYADVKSWLSLSDYGLMLRESSITNSVSSPTKTAEYLASGLPVITNENLAVARFIKASEVGVVLKDFELPADLEKRSMEMTERCQRVAHTFEKGNAEVKTRLERIYKA